MDCRLSWGGSREVVDVDKPPPYFSDLYGPPPPDECRFWVEPPPPVAKFIFI
jgi:hypothetical protein